MNQCIDKHFINDYQLSQIKPLSLFCFYLFPVLPSVSLLQRTPSSLVSCHATGFYPERAMMFWRRGEEEIHEGVEHGEILPNHDGSFQMSVELNVSSIKPEDWRRYDCVFQLSDVKEDIITKLDKTAIRTNWGEKGSGIKFCISKFTTPSYLKKQTNSEINVCMKFLSQQKFISDVILMSINYNCL